MRSVDRRIWIWIASLFIPLLITPGAASATFVGYYDVSNWTAIENYDANVDVTGAPNTIILTGAADQGTTLGGASDSLDFIINADVDSSLVFDWTYTSFDAALWDWGSFLLAGVEDVLATNADEPAGGTYAIALLAGQSFGFRVYSEDRAFSPGILTVSNFTVVPVISAPEPETATLVLIGLVWMSSISKRRSPRSI